MQRVLKWAGYGLASVVATVAVVALGGLTASEILLRMPQTKPESHMAATAGSQRMWWSRQAKPQG